MKQLLQAPVAYTVVVATMIGGVAVTAMIYGYTIEFRLPLPHIELSVRRNK